MGVYEELTARGLIAQVTNEFRQGPVLYRL